VIVAVTLGWTRQFAEIKMARGGEAGIGAGGGKAAQIGFDTDNPARVRGLPVVTGLNATEKAGRGDLVTVDRTPQRIGEVCLSPKTADMNAGIAAGPIPNRRSERRRLVQQNLGWHVRRARRAYGSRHDERGASEQEFFHVSHPVAEKLAARSGVRGTAGGQSNP
jgi:hypothetical protein